MYKFLLAPSLLIRDKRESSFANQIRNESGCFGNQSRKSLNETRISSLSPREREDSRVHDFKTKYFIICNYNCCAVNFRCCEANRLKLTVLRAKYSLPAFRFALVALWSGGRNFKPTCFAMKRFEHTSGCYFRKLGLLYCFAMKTKVVGFLIDSMII